MRISVLASGSSGNCTFIESKDTRVLVDAGISHKRLRKNLGDLGLDTKELDGVLITHEHEDHIKGLERLGQEVPVYLTKPTYDSMDLRLQQPMLIARKQEFPIKSLRIRAEPVSHDAVDPCGFVLRDNGTAAGVFTDLGRVDDNLREITAGLRCLLLESNHDVDMLLDGPYPYPLKERILSERGHLSNFDAGLLIKENASDELSKVFLAHLSESNNTEELAKETYEKLTKRRDEIVAGRNMTELIRF